MKYIIVEDNFHSTFTFIWKKGKTKVIVIIYDITMCMH
jgi:hypothetical protein